MNDRSVRVTEGGLMELLCDAEVVWGLHNSVISREKMLKGQRFNSFIPMVGSWHDVTPNKYNKRAAIQPFRRISDGAPDTTVERYNRKIVRERAR